MVSDDVARATETTTALQQHVADKMAALQAAEAHARIHAIAFLLEEEQANAAALEAEAAMTVLQLAPTTTSFSSALPPRPSGVDTAIIAMLHAQAYEV
jgi:hypothetical protein